MTRLVNDLQSLLSSKKKIKITLLITVFWKGGLRIEWIELSAGFAKLYVATCIGITSQDYFFSFDLQEGTSRSWSLNCRSPVSCRCSRFPSTRDSASATLGICLLSSSLTCVRTSRFFVCYKFFRSCCIIVFSYRRSSNISASARGLRRRARPFVLSIFPCPIPSRSIVMHVTREAVD